MFTSRLTRRSTMVCLCLLSLFVVGCGYNRPPYPAFWEIESVRLGMPEAAYLAADDSVVLRYHIQRELAPEDTGWRWLVIKPQITEQILMPREDERVVGLDVYERNFVRIRSEASEPRFGQVVNAQLSPKILEPGATDPTPPAEVTQPLTPLAVHVEEDEYGYQTISLRRPQTPGVATRDLDIWPTIERYQTERGARRERRARALTAPFRLVAGIVTAPVQYIVLRYALRNLDF